MGGRLEFALTRGLFAVACGAALASAACAQAGTSRGQVYSADVLSAPPHLVWTPPVPYPDSLRHAGVQGQVIVQLVIDTLGLPEPQSIRVMSSPNPAFAASAVATAQGMVFKPAEVNGQKVRVLVQIPVNFTLVTPPGATADVIWVTDSAAPCTGLTAGWWVDAARLQALVGDRGTVAPRADGKGLVLLFATTCPGSSVSGSAIDGKFTGPVALGAVIVRMQPRAPDSARGPDVRWSSMPEAFGPGGTPVTGLFTRYGYAMDTGAVTVSGDSSGGQRRARFVIQTPQGRVEMNATLVDSSSHFLIKSALISNGVAGIFGGPEWANRRSGTATVTATGTTLLSRLGITSPPDIVAYDTDFGWTFRFSHER